MTLETWLRWDDSRMKPKEETIINTAAITLTAAGTTLIMRSESWFGFALILAGAGLELIKYELRKG